MKRSRFLLPTATCAVVLAACAGGAPATEATSSSTATSVEVLEAARGAVGPAAVELGRSARQVATAAAAVDDEASITLLADEVSGLVDATADARALLASSTLPDDVAAALDAAVAAAAELATQAERAVVGSRLHLDLESEVTDLVGRWDDDASRSQQLERLDEVEDELRGIADDARVAPDDCDGGVGAWRDAAARAAELTAELLVHVRGYDGTSFDVTRADGREEVEAMAPAAPGPTTCTALAGTTAAAATVDEALGGVESALNPPELVPDG